VFLLKTVFWLAFLIAIIPAGKQASTAPQAGISTIEVLSVARDVWNDVSASVNATTRPAKQAINWRQRSAPRRAPVRECSMSISTDTCSRTPPTTSSTAPWTGHRA